MAEKQLAWCGTKTVRHCHPMYNALKVGGALPPSAIA